MPYYFYLVPPLLLLCGLGLFIYFWRKLEAPRRDSENVRGEEKPRENGTK